MGEVITKQGLPRLGEKMDLDEIIILCSQGADSTLMFSVHQLIFGVVIIHRD